MLSAALGVSTSASASAYTPLDAGCCVFLGGHPCGVGTLWRGMRSIALAASDVCTLSHASWQLTCLLLLSLYVFKTCADF